MFNVFEKVLIQELYKLNVGEIWKGFKGESGGFICLCIYTFIEYVRPQDKFSFLSDMPVAQIALLFALLFALIDKRKEKLSSPVNFWLFSFYFIIILSS